MMNNVLETSFRKRTLGSQTGWEFSGTLYKKKGNPNLYKLTSVIKEGKSPAAVWHERSFRISADGVMMYTKSSSGREHSVELRDCFVRLSSPLMDQYGQYHVHLHSLDGAPTPFTFEIGQRLGLESSWSLCAHNEAELMDWIKAILSHMYPFTNPSSMPSIQSLHSLPSETTSDAQVMNSRFASPELEYGERNNLDNQTSLPSITGMVNPVEEPASSLLSTGKVNTTASPTSRPLITWIRILEILVAFVFLNLLLALIRFAEPGSIESWLFAGATNLLVCFVVLVRMEQLLFSPDATRYGSLLSSGKSKRSNNPRSQIVSRIRDSLFNDDSDDDIDNCQPTLASIEPGVDAAIELNVIKPAIRRNVASSSLKHATLIGITSKDFPKHSYSTVDAMTLEVRCGPNYARDGKKAPSDSSLMDLVGCDLYYSKEKINSIAEKIIFPEPSYSGSTTRSPSPADPTGACKPLPGGLPHFFVFNLQAQDQGPTLFGSRSNSSGYSLVMYFEPSEDFIREVQELVEGRPCSNAVRLTYNWLVNSSKDIALKERLKLKATIVNEDVKEFLGWVSKYNGKPAMVTKSNKMTRLLGRTQQGRVCDVLECDVDLRIWNLLFRQGLSSVLPQAPKLCFNIALVIQGDTDDELPERILGVAQFNHLDLEAVSPWTL